MKKKYFLITLISIIALNAQETTPEKPTFSQKTFAQGMKYFRQGKLHEADVQFSFLGRSEDQNIKEKSKTLRNDIKDKYRYWETELSMGV